MSDANLSTTFGRATDAYERGRPGYPPEAVAWLLADVVSAGPGGSISVLDLGAGTGKLTRSLVDAGHDVTAVDPDPAMLDALRGALPGVPVHVGSAERIPSEAGRFDAVVMGQAWHWVDPLPASLEVGRVLRPGGTLGLVWNIRDGRTPWVRRMTEIMHGSHAEALIAEGGPLVGEPFAPLEAARFEWARPMTREDLRALAHSRSHVIAADAATRIRIDAELDALFASLPELDGDATIALPYVTYAFRTQRR